MMEAGQQHLRALVQRLRQRLPLSVDDQRALLDLPVSTRNVAAGEYLIKQGESSRSCVLLTSGFAQGYRLVKDGGRQIIGLHLAGDFVDLHFSMVHRASHSVQLLTPGKVADIPTAMLAELMHSRPAVAEAIWLDSLADASVFREWIVSLGRRDARGKLAHLVCEVGVRQESAGIGGRTCVQLPMTQEQLADALGLTSVHVNRTLKRMEAEGLIRRERSRITVPDWQQLAQAAGFSPVYLQLTAAAE